MRTVIISVIGISSFFLVVMIQKNINARTWEREVLEESLSKAMDQTLSEVMEKSSYGIRNRNEMMAAFLQAMLRKIRDNIDLTVKIYHVDYTLGQMDVEIMGEIDSGDRKSRKIAIRRKMIFDTGG